MTKDFSNYNPNLIEKKWQAVWEKSKAFVVDTNSSKPHFYNLWMFPYPSGEGLHAGHAFASTGSDIYGRFMRMNGAAVFQPIGYDSFGIHSENFAIKISQTPQEMLARTTKHYEEQLRSLGHGYDWTRTVTTSDIDYYRWTQWLFAEMFKAGLAYKKKATVNYCPSCKTVLADEQVMSPAQAGKEPKDPKGNPIKETEDLKVCERCGTVVEKKDLDQWFFRITDYADRLLSGLDKIDWSERVVTAQRNWIGKKAGMLINFDDIEVFTTRPETLEGVTFIAIASKESNIQEDKKKLGSFTGRYVENPLTNVKIPVWEANYVASEYGTGAIMGVPAYDERDRQFAEKYNLEIKEIEPDESLWEKIEDHNWGKKTVNYHLRDWLVSRQRYWGPPIPMIYCETCAKEGRSWLNKNKSKIHTDHLDWNSDGWWPEENLPVELPEIKEYQPLGTGKSPLGSHPEFYEVKCSDCGSDAKRETDVSDTFVDSSWYFLRYPSVSAESAGKLPFDTQIIKDWLPVSLYFGGAEHSVLHLMYARFVTMMLFDLGQLNFEEPFPKFFAHGLVIKDGAKMSKSRGNVVNPDEYIKKFGADTLRLYTMFMGPMDGYPDFRDTGIEGMQRFIKRVWRLFNTEPRDIDQKAVSVKMHQTIKKVTEDIQNFRYNTAIASLMEYVNILEENGSGKESLTNLALLLAPFAPHLAEEVWNEVLGNKASINVASWPNFDPKYLETSEVEIIVQVNGKLRGQLTINKDQAGSEDKVVEIAKSDPKIAKWVDGESIKKVIFVPNKLLNFVI